MVEYEECEKCGYKYIAANRKLPCLFDMYEGLGLGMSELIEGFAYYGSYCVNDDKCSKCRHFDPGSNECSLYEDVEDELYWETVEEYGEEAADELF
jgi:hypothetical protein